LRWFLRGISVQVSDTNVSERTETTTAKNGGGKRPGAGCNLGSTVIWFFDRNGEKLRYEIRRDRSDGRYRLVITQPDGTESVEEIDQATDLIERSVTLMNNLRSNGWRVA
jgi:hypothetical protein